MSSSIPTAASISSVAGCKVEARGASFTASAASKTRTGMPRCASASAVMTPTGPAPAIRMGGMFMTVPLLLLDAGGLDRFRPGCDVGGEHRAIFGGRVAERIDTELRRPRREFRILDSL